MKVELSIEEMKSIIDALSSDPDKYRFDSIESYNTFRDVCKKFRYLILNRDTEKQIRNNLGL